MAKTTQKGRVMRALERTGKRGITQADFLGPDVVDGGRPITRLAARIDELKQDGVTIVAGGHRDGGCIIYRLAAHAARSQAVEHATGLRCLACGTVPARETSGPCLACGAYALARLLIVEPAAQSESTAA